MLRRLAPLALAAATLLSVLPLLHAQRAAAPADAAAPRATGAPKILVEKNIEARMRDGVVLRADVYRPDTTERLPAFLQRTPYSKNPGQDDNSWGTRRPFISTKSSPGSSSTGRWSARLSHHRWYRV